MLLQSQLPNIFLLKFVKAFTTTAAMMFVEIPVCLFTTSKIGVVQMSEIWTFQTYRNHQYGSYTILPNYKNLHFIENIVKLFQKYLLVLSFHHIFIRVTRLYGTITYFHWFLKRSFDCQRSLLAGKDTKHQT